MSACTRANPDAIGGGGSGGGGGGGAAGSGGGGGGSAGGGGIGGGPDLSMATPHDMRTAPADMTSFEGVYCGTMICLKPTSECCAEQTTVTCQSPTSACSRPFDCDGPEDCMSGERCCGSINGSMCGGNGGSGCSNGDVPLCHTLADCGGSDGFVACCGATNGGHLRFCSKQPCM